MGISRGGTNLIFPSSSPLLNQHMGWTPTYPNPDGTVTIKGVTYTQQGEDNYWHNSDPEDRRAFRYFDGFMYIEDPNHDGLLYVSEDCAKRYGLCMEEGFELDDDDQELLSGLFGPDHPYAFQVGLDHCLGVVDGSGEEAYRLSPRGDTETEEFIGWWNGFSGELFNEPAEHLFVNSMMDG